MYRSVEQRITRYRTACRRYATIIKDVKMHSYGMQGGGNYFLPKDSFQNGMKKPVPIFHI